MEAWGVIIVGGGASGLTAAIEAAGQLGPGQVLLLERGPRVGKKLLATGNGRCNLSNRQAGLSHYHGRDPGFVLPALRRFPVKSTLDFFYKFGLVTVEEENGKLYPRSLQASAVLDLLRMEAERLGVETRCDREVTEVRPQKGRFLVTAGEETFAGQTVILAAGGAASSGLGGCELGYALLEKLGHRRTPLLPAIVQLKADTTHIRPLAGTKVDGVVTLPGKSPAQQVGEILFTDYGISGPPVMSLSSLVTRRLAAGPVTLFLDLAPDLQEERLLRLLSGRKQARPDKTLEVFLVGLFPKRVGQCALKAAGILPLSRTAGSLSPRELETLARQLKHWPVTITGTNGMKNAQVTAGGIETAGFDPETMESRLVPGLYGCGEVLDIDGDCGGYNLQWAWSSGRLAGSSAARLISPRQTGKEKRRNGA